MNKDKEEEFLDLEECLRPIAKQWGRAMFTLVLYAGMGREAAEVLAKANKGMPRLLHAVGLLANGFNVISQELITAKGWSQEDLAQCEEEIKRAWAGRLVEVSQVKLIH